MAPDVKQWKNINAMILFPLLVHLCTYTQIDLNDKLSSTHTVKARVRSYYAAVTLRWPQSRCIGTLHRNCNVTVLRCRMKVKFILTWNVVMLWVAAESDQYIGTTMQLRCSMNGSLQHESFVAQPVLHNPTLTRKSDVLQDKIRVCATVCIESSIWKLVTNCCLKTSPHL